MSKKIILSLITISLISSALAQNMRTKVENLSNRIAVLEATNKHLQIEIENNRQDIAGSTYIPRDQWGQDLGLDISVQQNSSKYFFSLGLQFPKLKNRIITGTKLNFAGKLNSIENDVEQNKTFSLTTAISALVGLSSPLLFNFNRIYGFVEVFYANDKLVFTWTEKPTTSTQNKEHFLSFNLMGGIEFFTTKKYAFLIEGGLPLVFKIQKNNYNFNTGFVIKIGLRRYLAK